MHSHTFKDLTGQTFGDWSVLRYSHTIAWGAYWLCRCSCGSEQLVSGRNLRGGRTKRCKDCKPKNQVRHGHAGKKVGGSYAVKRSPTYTTWYAMIGRCYRPGTNCYDNYGGRGIRVCDRWLVFDNFLADMGERPVGMTIDRRDPDGDYEPLNCRWATASQQNRNRRKVA